MSKIVYGTVLLCELHKAKAEASKRLVRQLCCANAAKMAKGTGQIAEGWGNRSKK